MAIINNIWAEKYRPKTLNEYIFQNQAQAAQVKAMLDSGEIPHLLLSGPPGTGKTSLVDIIVNTLQVDSADILRINASDNNSVEYVREVVSSFAMSYPMGKFKIVRLEEADYLSHNAQGTLRVPMEETADTCRFIFTCNYDNRIMPALKSRVQQLFIKAPSHDEVMVRVGEILMNEGVTFEIETLDKFVAAAYPDIRKIINNVEHSSRTGTLIYGDEAQAIDYHFELLELLENGDLKAARKLICDNVQREEFETIYRFLYENINRIKKLPVDDAVVVIADYLYKHGIVADPEINFAACMIELDNLRK